MMLLPNETDLKGRKVRDNLSYTSLQKWKHQAALTIQDVRPQTLLQHTGTWFSQVHKDPTNVGASLRMYNSQEQMAEVLRLL